MNERLAEYQRQLSDAKTPEQRTRLRNAILVLELAKARGE